MKNYTAHISKNSSRYKINKLSNSLNKENKRNGQKNTKISGQSKKVRVDSTI